MADSVTPEVDGEVEAEVEGEAEVEAEIEGQTEDGSSGFQSVEAAGQRGEMERVGEHSKSLNGT